MQVDFKISTWERIEIPEGHEKRILELIKNGDINSANDMFNHLEDISCERMEETDEQMMPEENDGQSTIEVLENGVTIYNNSLK